MSDHGDATWIGNARGQTHTGSGNQYNYFVSDTDRLIRSGGDPLRIAAERRLWLSERFVPPDGYAEALRKLEEPGTAVLVSGAEGSGRRTAAVVLLHCSGEPGDPFREVTSDDQQAELGELSHGERVLIDLTDLSDQQVVDAQGLMKSYWAKVEGVAGRLVVVLSRDHEHLLQPDVRQLLIRLGRPAGGEVLASHLGWAGIEVSVPELRQSSLGELLDSSPMRELERLHELVVEASSAGGDFAEWADKAGAALSERLDEVARQIAKLEDGRQRALLFTAAMLDGAPAVAVFRLSDQLLTRVGHPEDERPRLDRADLRQRVRDLGMVVEEGRIGFTKLAYAAAVRDHVWSYYPDLRDAFGAWVGDAIRATTWLDAPDRRRMVARFTEQALQAGDVGLLTDLVASWAKENRLLPVAMLVLEEGVTSGTCGSAFRAKTYEWSVGPPLPTNLVRGLARICVDVMAVRHPGQALVRLHHLARRETADGPRHARDALRELVGRDRYLYLGLLSRVLDGLERSEPVLSDAEIFLELVDPLPFWVSDRDAVRGWRGMLAVASFREACEVGVRNWLEAARRARDGGERLLGILVRAADGRVPVLSRYYLLAHEWAAGPEDHPGPVSRAEVATRFCRKIDHVQGIEPLVGATGGRGL
ncbi:hypothetical protein ACWDD9_08970 [Kitasatospora sp. NPDC001119]